MEITEKLRALCSSFSYLGEDEYLKLQGLINEVEEMEIWNQKAMATIVKAGTQVGIMTALIEHGHSLEYIKERAKKLGLVEE